MHGENGPQLDGWQLPRRCCGTWADDLACSICGCWIKVPANVVLGDN